MRFNEEKGKFKSYAYSYIIERMKSALTEETIQEERESPVEDFWVQAEMTHDDFSAVLWESMLEKVSTLLSENQRKWVKAY
ncbi:hypothetical protein [Metabacillus schmidteae]|uniref:hypothetical protein n=1 Tax=Metabacillus schmidteae TaxID=2730405 RepID=UPI00158C3858|nr:hypothetical protein [Metabacillus schmidteae]